MSGVEVVSGRSNDDYEQCYEMFIQFANSELREGMGSRFRDEAELREFIVIVAELFARDLAKTIWADYEAKRNLWAKP